MEHSYSRLAMVAGIKGQKEGVSLSENHFVLHNRDKTKSIKKYQNTKNCTFAADKMDCSPESANVVWMDHCYFSFKVNLEKEEEVLSKDIHEGDFNLTAGLRTAVSGQFRVKEEPGEERPFACSLEARVLPAADVWMDHSYNRAQSEQESRNFNTILVKREPNDADKNDCTNGDQPVSVSGQFPVKEEPDEEDENASCCEAEVLPAADVWMDHNYNRAIAQSEQESRDFNAIFVKVEPNDADKTDCPDRALLISENDASLAEDDLDFAFASCELTPAPRAGTHVLNEHNYVSLLGAEALTRDVGALMEADPLSLDQEPRELCPKTEDQSTVAEEPSEEFRARLCAINDEAANQQPAGKGTFEMKKISTSSELPVNKDNLPIFQCRLCHESFDSYPDFDCHFSLWHKKSTNDYNYVCHICGWSARSTQELVAHLNWEHDSQINLSKVLKESITSVQSGSKTFLAEVKKPLCCRACRDVFECETDLKIHLLLDRCRLSCVEYRSETHANTTPFCKQNRNSHTCRMCNQSFMHPGRLLRHLMLQNCDEKLTCNFCRNTFLTSSSLEEHQELSGCTERNPSRLLQACWQVPDSVKSKLDALTNSKIGFYQCHICEETFRFNKDLTRHFTSNHIDFTADDFCCRRREYEFKTNLPDSIFSSEIKPHADANSLHLVKKYPQQASKLNYPCEICKKTFENKSQLQCHKEIHKTRHDVTCVECDRCFTLTSNLKKHLMRCRVVPIQRAPLPRKILPAILKRIPPVKTYARFAKKSILPSPECAERLQSCAPTEAVSGEEVPKPAKLRSCANTFTCDSCQKTVSTKSELRNHLKSHVTEQNFGCLECKEYFTYAVDFIKHTKWCSENFVRDDKTLFKISPFEKQKRKRRLHGKERKQINNAKSKGIK